MKQYKNYLLWGFVVWSVVSFGGCISYAKYVAGLEYDMSYLGSPHYTSEASQLSLLCSMRYKCEGLKGYKEYLENPTAPPCAQAEKRIREIAKKYENPKIPGVFLIPQQKIAYRYGCAFTFTAWNTTGVRFVRDAVVLIFIQMTNGDLRQGREIIPLYLNNSYWISGQTRVFGDIFSDEVESVQFVITQL